MTDLHRAAESLGQPWHTYFAGCLAQGRAFCRGDFAQAEQRAAATLQLGQAFGVDSIDGSYGVQMLMIHRETGRLDGARRHLTGRWVAGLLALYTGLGVTEGVRRTLRHLLDTNLAGRTTDAQWPIELTFLTEGALALGDRDAAVELRPFLAAYAGTNLVGGTSARRRRAPARPAGRADGRRARGAARGAAPGPCRDRRPGPASGARRAGPPSSARPRAAPAAQRRRRAPRPARPRRTPPRARRRAPPARR